MRKHVVIIDDNHTIQVWLYEGREGVAAEVTPQQALRLAAQLLDAASRHLNNPPTGLKLFP
jgi:phenylpyruvate tautomerase PptA (4-oxalocrotonate tautomerase family)